MVNHKILVIYIMSDLISEPISESEQMYLITIARSIEDGGPEPLPLSYIAQKMSLQSVSVNQMVRKLEAEGLVHYHPYKGVELTTLGQAAAERTLRNRRLWEVFLVNQINVPLEEADAMACDLEHVTPDNIAQRLSKYLDDPAIGPGGQPIPKIDGDQFKPVGFPLSQLEVGMSAQIVDVNAEPAIARFLAGEGLRPGAEISLVAVGAHGTRLLAVDQGYVEITADIAESIQLLPTAASTGSKKL
jgi:DtxR family Mn-dependent transcriptional regulator